jgi:hypothetical protein
MIKASGKGTKKFASYVINFTLTCFDVTLNLSDCEIRLNFADVFPQNDRAFVCAQMKALKAFSDFHGDSHRTLFGTYFDLGSACKGKCFQI